MSKLKIINKWLRFIIEVIDIIILTIWGAKTGHGLYMKIGLSISSPIVIVIIWGLYGSPNARFPLPKSIHFLLELIVFCIPIVALYSMEKVSFAISLAIIFLVNRFFLFLWKQ